MCDGVLQSFWIPKGLLPFVQVNDEETGLLRKSVLNTNSHWDFWSTPNFHSDCTQYTSTVGINISETGTASILRVSKNRWSQYPCFSSPQAQNKCYTLGPLIISRPPGTSARISKSHSISWLCLCVSFSSCGKYLWFPKDVSGCKPLPRNATARDYMFHRVYPDGGRWEERQGRSGGSP